MGVAPLRRHERTHTKAWCQGYNPQETSIPSPFDQCGGDIRTCLPRSVGKVDGVFLGERVDHLECKVGFTVFRVGLWSGLTEDSGFRPIRLCVRSHRQEGQSPSGHREDDKEIAPHSVAPIAIVGSAF